jgi:hypothetical protein
MAGTWQAGAAEVVITPPIGGQLEGYGGRDGGSTGVHDDLRAHALVLDDGSRRAAIVTCDVLGLDAPIVARVRQAAGEWDIPPERVLVACSHTHAGPRGLLSRRGADTGLVDVLVRQLVGALRAALGELAPARLMAGEGRVDSVSLNRRFPDGPIDTAVRVLRVEGSDGQLRAALVNYGCHPTILNWNNLRVSRDWPGYAEGAIKALWGEQTVVLFANGACADINPVKISESFDETRRVGTIVGAEAARVLGELAAHGRDQVVHNLLWSERPLKPPSNGVPLAPGLAGASVPVRLPWKRFLDDDEYKSRLDALRAELASLDASPPSPLRVPSGRGEGKGEGVPSGDGGAAQGEGSVSDRRRLRQRLNALSAEAAVAPTARPAAAEHPDGLPTEVQALVLGAAEDRAGRLALVTAPGELMFPIGDAIARASPVPRTWPIGYANDAVGYLVTDAAHDEGGYEAGRSMFVAGVEAQLKDAAARAIGAALEQA